jgi:hypothetical protein
MGIVDGQWPFILVEPPMGLGALIDEVRAKGSCGWIIDVHPGVFIFVIILLC